MALEKEYKDKIIELLTALFPKAKIYLYGSRARDTESTRSDIDIAIDAGEKLKSRYIGEAQDVLEATIIPYQFDVIDLNRVPQRLREEVLKEGVLWKS